MKRLHVLAPRESRGGARCGQPPATRRGLRPHGRGGATLSEILISLMVMGIGVTSLALLISTSVLRSIQASQLTNATIHRLNAEEMVKLFPWLIVNPDADLSSSPTYLSEHQLFGVANSNPAYAVDNPLNTGSRFIVDPQGYNRPTLSGVRDRFGNNGSGITQAINRYFGGFDGSATLTLPSLQSVAIPTPDELTYLRDSWRLMATGLAPTLNANNSITVVGTVDTQVIEDSRTSLAPDGVRVILFSPNGKHSVVRNVTSASGNNISWDDGTTTNDDLPTSGFGTISRYRVEVRDNRYSWLLTVRNPQVDLTTRKGSANVDVVVFHNRSFAVADEQIYDAIRGTGDDASSLRITIPSSGQKPFLKKGGFLFDAENAYWYRITQFNESTNKVSVDRPIPGRTGIIAMPGVVEVYPAGSVTVDLDSYLPR